MCGDADEEYTGTVDVKGYIFFRDPSFLSLCLPFLSLGAARRAAGHGQKVFWGGYGAAAGKCATRIAGCHAERDEECGKDLKVNLLELHILRN